MSARLDKILHDIWDNKARSLLVILTLAIGIAAVGTINNTVRMLKRDLYGEYARRSPASVSLYVSPFPKSLAGDIEGMREVLVAQPRRTLSAFVILPDGTRKTLKLIAGPDFGQQTINRLQIESGPANPALRGILLERSSAAGVGLSLGQPLALEMPNGQAYTLSVDGLVQDLTQIPYSISGDVLGYISMSTLEWLGEAPYYNQLNLIVAENQHDREHVLKIAALARDRVIEPRYQVGAVMISGDPNPGDFWARRQIDGVLLVLQIMSILAIVLSAGLVVNTITAVLVQQTRQIGIMRSVGASRRQIISLYLGYVLALSLLGLLLALPLGLLGAWALTKVAGVFMNFDISAIDLPPSIWLLQAGLGLLIPLGTALGPVLQSARLSVYAAIYQSGTGSERKNWLTRQLTRIHLLSPPVMLSLRNTFRNRARLAFTLATLTIAGSMFMAVFSAYNTIQGQISELGRYIAFDAELSIPGGANKHTVEREAMRIPAVQFAEGWASANVVIVHADGSESDRVELIGLPANARTIQPRLVAGRWLQPGDNAQVVVNEDLLNKEPSIGVGSHLAIEINNQQRSLEVVGIVSQHMSGSRLYLPYEQFSRISGRRNQVDMVRVLAAPGSFSAPLTQASIGAQLEQRFEDAQLSQSSSSTRFQIFDSMSGAFNILLIVLLLVALILAVIGGLGLTGAMGLNVLERTREIGVLRAVGASHASVRQVVMVEGAVVALISWALSALLSYPAGRLLSGAVVNVAFGAQAPFQYSPIGLFVWLVVVLLIGLLASLAPARSAVRLTVREVLNYE